MFNEYKCIHNYFSVYRLNKKLVKLEKYFADFNFRGSQLTAKYRENWTTRKFLILRYMFSWKQTIQSLIRLLAMEQSDLDQYCLQYRLPICMIDNVYFLIYKVECSK